MKILMIFQAAPLPPPRDMGSAKRNFPFFRENVKRHEVSVLSFGSEEELQIFRARYGAVCKTIRFVPFKRHRFLNLLKRAYLVMTGQAVFRMLYRRSFQRAIDELVSREQFDLIHCCTAIMGYYSFPAGVPLVGDTHNVEYDLVHRMYLETSSIIRKIYCYLVYRSAKRAEPKCLLKFDAVVTTTQQDLELFRKDLPNQRLVVIQNGIDPSFFVPQRVETKRKSIVFVGLMNWYPNQNAVRYFLRDVFPKVLAVVPDVRFTVVGPNPPKDLLEASSSSVIFTGFVEDVRPYVAENEVFIIPLLIGSGIRGKALEAMAMRKPIVSTTLGCAGIHLTNRESVLLADTADEFAEAIIHLFEDPELGRVLTENAYAIAMKLFNWETKGMELDRLYQSVTARKAVRTRDLRPREPEHVC